MTVSSSVAKSGPYAGAGTTGPFTVGFRFLANSHLQVVKTATTGADSTLILDTDYTVAGAGGATGTVTLAVALAVGEKLTIVRSVPATQEADYVQNDAFPAESHETALDKLTMLAQQNGEAVGRAIKVRVSDAPLSELPSPSGRANTLIGFDATGNVTVLPITSSVGAGDRIPYTLVSGVDFLPGATTVTLPRAPGSKGNLELNFDGSVQEFAEWNVSDVTVTFTAPIPAYITKIWGYIGTTLSTQIPPADSVGDTQLTWGTVLNRVVDSIVGLKALSSAKYKRVFVTGYYGAGDGGGGHYYYDAADTTSADNGGTIIVALDGARWKLKRDKPISFKQFGAKFDGVTSDTAAINAALAGAGPGIIIAPAGTCITAGNHTIGAGQYILGAGQGATVFSCTHLTNDIFKMPNTYSGISDCTITGDAARSGGRHIYNSAGIGPTHIGNVSLSNCFVGIELNGTGQYVKNAIINDSTAPASPLSYGIHISGGNDQFVDGVILNCASGKEFTGGLAITQCEAAWVTNCDFIHAKNGVLVAPSGAGFVRFLFFENVACDTATDNAWYFLTAGTATISTCSFTNCWGASAANQGLLAQGNGGAISGLSFSNTRMVNNGLDGMYFQNNVRNVVLNGGLISGNSQTSPASSYGIHIGTNQNDFAITGLRIGPDGHFADTQLAQIRVDPGSGDRISIVGCDLNTAHTPVDMLGSGSNNTISGCTGGTLKGRISTTTDGSGHITVTHNMGTIPTTILATVENDGSAIFVQASGVRTTTNFQLKFYNASGAALANTAVSFSWMIDF